jgi:methionyl-tRNA formyltransferase
VPQAEEGVTIAPKIEPDDRRLDPARSPLELERRVRALNPHVGTWIALGDGERLVVRRAAAITGEGPAPGELTESGGRLLWGCAGGALDLLVVQPAGGRAMDAADFLRGHGPKLAPSG